MRSLEAMVADGVIRDELVNYKLYNCLLLSPRYTSAFIISYTHFFGWTSTL